MLQLYGQPSLSSFRLERLLALLRQAAIEVVSIEADHLYFVDLSQSLTLAQIRSLEHLLEAKCSLPERAVAEGNQWIVAPRPGTISPWSSKATDIAHLCGLTKIRRLERGVVFGSIGTMALLSRLLSVKFWPLLFMIG